MKKIKQLLRKLYSLRRIPYQMWLRRRVTNRKFLLLSSGCNGGLLLHDLGMPFNTPTVNMAFFSFDKFCADLEHYLSLTPKPVPVPEGHFPIVMLGDIRIEGTHYRDYEDFLDCWNRRLARFNALRQEGYEILLMTTEDNLSKTDGLERYFSLPFRKVCFTPDPGRQGEGFVYIPRREKNGYRDSWRAAGLLGIRVFEKAMDVPTFLNGSKAK